MRWVAERLQCKETQANTRNIKATSLTNNETDLEKNANKQNSSNTFTNLTSHMWIKTMQCKYKTTTRPQKKSGRVKQSWIITQ